MRIQTSEMLATPDTEMVLRVLERSLRDVSIEAVRNGRRIVVRGLGPSQRTMNRNDIAVVEVVSENHRTLIRADINYQASALLGGVKQDEVMRLKIDRVMDRVKMELGTQGVRVEAVSWFADPTREPGYVIDEAPVVEHEDVFRPQSTGELAHAIEQGHARELQQGIKAEPVTEPAPVKDVGHGIGLEDGLGPVGHGEQERFVESKAQLADKAEPVAAEVVGEPGPEVMAEQAASVQSVVPESIPVAKVVDKPIAVESVPVVEVAKKPVAAAASSSEKKSGEIPIFQAFHPVETTTPKRWGLLATVLCMLAALGLFLAWPYLAGLVHERLHPASSVPDGKIADQTPETPNAAADPSAAQLPDANVVAMHNAAMLNESDPKVWLASWANALSGQDAGVQASFYADPVEHYAVKSNVSNADVWLDKKNEIQSRPKNSTVTLDKVEIEPRPDESLRVRLTKHFTSQSGKGRASEQFIHSQLTLRKIEGQWKITSEQNLRQ